jgi:hypothetical protein
MRSATKDHPRLATILWTLGLLGLQLALIASYAGALHAPRPHDVPLAVAGPPAQAAAAARRLDTSAFAPRVVADADAAQAAIRDRDVLGAVVLGRRVQVLVAPAGDASVALLLRDRAPALGRALGAPVEVRDAAPLPRADPRGITGFYLVLGWVVGGYLVAAFAGVRSGERPGDRRAIRARLGAFALYALASGATGVLVVHAATGALGGHALALAALGTLIVFAVAASTALLQQALGIAGIGVAILLMVVLGNPSSGGPYARVLLPEPWAAFGGLLPPGAGTEAVKDVTYFSGAGVGGPAMVLVAWAAVATAGMLAVAPRTAP